MTSDQTRRRFLASLGSGITAAAAGCAQWTGSSSQAVAEQDLDPLEHDRTIGAYYYTRWGPWLNTNERENWTSLSPDEPVIGAFDSTDPAVANQHIKWAREHGINWLNASWGGANMDGHHNPQEEALQKGFMEAELKDEIDFSLFYESGIPLETAGGSTDFDRRQPRERLQLDFGYMEDEYFDEPNYLTIDGRPVVTFYATHSFEGDVGGAFADATDAISSDPYLIADVWGGRNPHGVLPTVEHDWIDVFDAVTGWDLYKSEIVEEADGAYSEYADWGAKELKEWAIAADEIGLDHIPSFLPGLNDTHIDHRPQEIQHPILERDPDGFREMARTAYDHMDPDLDTLLVTTLNGWPEYTSVAPSESYGETYLDIIEEELGHGGEPDYFDPDPHPLLELRFDRTVPTPNGDPAEMGMMMDRIDLQDADGQMLHTYDIGVRDQEPYLLKGIFPPEHTPDGQAPYDRWRWMGDSTAETAMCLDPEYADATEAAIHGQAPSFADGPVAVDVYVDGERTDRLTLGREPATHRASLRP